MSSEKVEDLVKKALKEAMDKRKVAALGITPAAETMETILESMCPKVSLDFSKSILKVNQVRLSDVINDKSLVENEDFGVTVFDDYEWDHPDGTDKNPKPAIDAWLAKHKNEIEIFRKGWQVWIKKTK